MPSRTSFSHRPPTPPERGRAFAHRDEPRLHRRRPTDFQREPPMPSTTMAGGKRAGRDLSPRQLQDSKKARLVNSNGHPKQPPVQSPAATGNRTQDSAKPFTGGTKARVNSTSTQPESRSGGSAPASRPESPATNDKSKDGKSRDSSKAASTPASPQPTADKATRPPLKVNTAAGQANTSASPPTANANGSRKSSASTPLPRGPPPVAQMIARSATETPPTSMTKLNGDRPHPKQTFDADELVKILRIWILETAKRDELSARWQKVNQDQLPSNWDNRQVFARRDARALAVQQELEAAKARVKDLGKEVKPVAHALGSSLQWLCAGLEKLTTRVQNLETLENRNSVHKGMVKQVLSKGFEHRQELIITEGALESKVEKMLEAKLASKEKELEARFDSMQSETVRLREDSEMMRKTLNANSTAKDLEYRTKISKLEEDNTKLRSELDGLREQVQQSSLSNDPEFAKVKNDFTALKNNTSPADKAIAGLKSKCSALEQKVDALSSDLNRPGRATGNADRIQNKVAGFDDELQALKKEIASLNDKVDKDLLDPESEVQQRIILLQSSYSTLSKLVNNMHSDDISQLRRELEAIQDKSKKQEEKLDLHQQSIDTFDRDLKSDNKRIRDSNRDIDALSAKVRTIDHDLDDLETDVGAVSGTNDNLASKINTFDETLKSTQSQCDNFSATAKSLLVTTTDHKTQLERLESKIRSRSSSSASPAENKALLEEVNRLKTNLETQKKILEDTASGVKKMGKDWADVRNRVEGLEALEKRFDTWEEKQTLLQESVEQTANTVDSLVLQDHAGAMTSLESKFDEVKKEFTKHEELLNGLQFPDDTQNAELVQKHVQFDERLKDLERELSAVRESVQESGKQFENTQSRADDTQIVDVEPGRRTRSQSLTSAANKKVAQLEREIGLLRKGQEKLRSDHGELQGAHNALRIDFETFQNEQESVDLAVEADMEKKIEREVAKVMAPRKSGLDPDSTLHLITQSENSLREEFQQKARELTETISHGTKELIEKTASRHINPQLISVNDKLSKLQELLQHLQSRYPQDFQDVLADLHALSKAQGRLSAFFSAIFTAIRSLQARFDNIQTQEMALKMLNLLLPQISQRLAQPIANMLSAPLRDQLAPYILEQLGPVLQRDLNNMQQKIEGASRSNTEIANRNQLLREEQNTLSVKVEDLERHMAEAVERFARLRDDVERRQDNSRGVEGVRSDLEKHEQLIWDTVKEYRGEVGRVFDDIGAIQKVLGQFAEKLDGGDKLVPREWIQA